MPSSQRLLLSTAAAPPSELQQSFAVDSDVVVILAALLCALICVVGLAFVARCACFHRFGNNDDDRLPPPPAKGLKKKAIRSLSKIEYTSSVHSKVFSECPICLVEFEEGDEVRVLPGCGHGFHAGCVDTWLGSRSSCPSCRRVMVVVEKKKGAMEPVRCGKCGAREVQDGNNFLP